MPGHRSLRIGWALCIGHLRVSLLSLARKPGFLDLPIHSRSHPNKPDQSRNDTICDFAAAGVVGEFQAETAVDDADGDDDATEPDVGVRPCSATTVALECDVVDVAEDGLKDEKREDDDSDYGVVCVDLGGGIGVSIPFLGRVTWGEVKRRG